MSDKKNIDHLFQDAFQDFEASPDPALWDKISDKLDAKETKRKREGIFFLPWLYKATGIAAAIVLFFFVGNEFLNSDETEIDTDEQITTTTKNGSSTDTTNENTTNSHVTDTNTNSEQNSSKNQQNSSDTVLQNNKRFADDTENGVDNNGNHLQNRSTNSTQERSTLQNAVVNQDGTNSNSNSNSQQLSTNRLLPNSTQNNNSLPQENAVVNSNSTRNTNSNVSNEIKNNSSQNTVKGVDRFTNTVAQNSTNNTSNNTNATTNSNQNGVNGTETNINTATNSNSTAVAQNNTNTANSSSSNTDATANTETTNSETAIAEVKKEDEIKKSLLDEINDLHDLEKDKTEVAEQNRRRWTISPNASPIYYNTLSNGSPIDETFADNTKSGDLNFSYGVNVGYDVSKRLTVRSGIHKVDYSYNTKDIALVPSINGNELTTIAFKTDGVAFDIQDRQVNAPSDAAFSQYQLPSTESSIIRKQIEGNLNQRMSYIEVPVELKYAVVDKKLGVNVIGGVSTLLLTENSIILDSPELYAELGEATNVNDVSFSTNIGLGIDYKVSDKIEVNFEPMLKYQLNTFSGNTGNFKPYSVGVYTGVSFRF
ncbi:hypothetical protein [Kordia sp.]|uniref:hypothetical protein n=1 Tax=Kordia sp. TaxID=1965332 RepID=UPI003B58EC61